MFTNDAPFGYGLEKGKFYRMIELDVFWSIRSPYSYLATPDMLKLREDFNAKINLRVVYPAAIRNPKLFTNTSKHFVNYLVMDAKRRSSFLSMPFVWPDPDPILQDLTTRVIAKYQPHIFRLSYLAVEAERQGKGLEFAYHISHLIFGGTKDWNNDLNLSQVSKKAGLSYDNLLSAVEGSNHHTEILENKTVLDEAGHWGVPTFLFRGEPFFGQDRVETLRWRVENYIKAN